MVVMRNLFGLVEEMNSGLPQEFGRSYIVLEQIRNVFRNFLQN